MPGIDVWREHTQEDEDAKEAWLELRREKRAMRKAERAEAKADEVGGMTKYKWLQMQYNKARMLTQSLDGNIEDQPRPWGPGGLGGGGRSRGKSDGRAIPRNEMRKLLGDKIFADCAEDFDLIGEVDSTVENDVDAEERNAGYASSTSHPHQPWGVNRIDTSASRVDHVMTRYGL